MTALRAILALSGLGLLGLILWASLNSGELHGSIWQQGGYILAMPWGVVAMADLYLGFIIAAVVIFLTERNWLFALLWIVPIFVLGNVWVIVWLVVRLPHLAKQLSRPDWPTS